MMPKINKLAREWVDALRSGDYEQTSSVLCSSNESYCCWGVLCDLIDPDGWVVQADNEHSWEEYSWEINGETFTELPPPEVYALVGMTEREMTGLVDLNDSGNTFEEIADEIERILGDKV